MKYTFSYKHLIVFLCFTLVILRFLSDPVNMLTWDVFGYYLYLPANFIYSDLTLQSQDWLNHLLEVYEPTSTLYQAVKIENGEWVMKYSMGMSLLYAPFFFIAHLIAEPLGYPADGLSLPYQYAITIGGLIYAVIGLIYFSKILRCFFNQYVSGILLLIIFFGTNYFQLTIFEGTLLSHNFLFMLYAILIYFTIKWYNEYTFKNIIIIGLTIGLITLIRPSEAICILIPILWSNAKDDYLKNKWNLIKTYYLQLIVAGFCVFIMLLPQLLYWKSVTGNYLFYSYTNAGEGFDFLSPHTSNFLFSFRKGWLVYTPIILFAFIGLYHLYKKNKAICFSITTFIIVDIYLCSSWTNWWYAGGSFSSRSMVPAYVLLAIPLGFFIEKVNETKRSKIIFYSIGIFFILLNLFQTWQFENNIISKERMTRAYYFSIFGKTHVEPADEKLLLVDRTVDAVEIFKNEKEYKGKILYNNTFDELGNKKVFELDGVNCFSPGVDIKYRDITQKDHAWIKVSAKVFIPADYDEELPVMVATFHYKGEVYKYYGYELKAGAIKLNTWNTIEFDYLTPEVRSLDDNLKVYLWHRGQKRILLDDLKVLAFEHND